MKPFQWGRFSDFIDADIVDGKGVRHDRNGSFEFSSKTLSDGEGGGLIEYLHTPDFRVLAVDCALAQDKRYEIADQGLIRFHFGFALSIRSTIRGANLAGITSNAAGLLLAASDDLMVEEVPRQQQQRFVTIACRPQWLDSHFGINLEKHVPPYQMDQDALALHRPFQFDNDLKNAVRTTLSYHPAGRLRSAFLTNKAQELLILTLDNFAKVREEQSHRLNERDITAIRRARDILEHDLVSPPDIQTLSRLAGINRTKLFYGFKQLYGMSVMQVIDARRMETASERLLYTDMSISDIAREVGYEHAANFATRFKTYFGCSPREFKRQR